MNFKRKILKVSVFALSSSNYFYDEAMIFTGGSERQMRNIVDCLSLFGSKVDVFISDNDSSIQYRKDINIVPLLNTNDNLINKIINVIIGIRNNSSEIIYLRGISMQNLFVLLLGFIFKKKTILGITSDLQVLKTNSKIDNLKKLLSFILAKKIVVQTKQQNYLLKNFFNKSGQRFNNMINKNYFIKKNNQIVNNHNRRIDGIWIGTIEKRKGVSHFITLADNFSENNFIIIGANKKNEEQYAKSIMKEINNTPNINYLGFIQPNEIAKYLNDAKVLISTSEMLSNNYTKEGFPNIFLEAWLFGTPVISMNSDPDNLFSEIGLGYLTPTAESLKKAFFTLINNQTKWNSISNKSKEYALSRDINNIEVQKELHSLFIN